METTRYAVSGHRGVLATCEAQKGGLLPSGATHTYPGIITATERGKRLFLTAHSCSQATADTEAPDFAPRKQQNPEKVKVTLSESNSSPPLVLSIQTFLSRFPGKHLLDYSQTT